MQIAGELEALRMLADRRQALTSRRFQSIYRLQALLAELLPGPAKRDITTGRAKAMLATVRPRDIAGKTRRGPGVGPVLGDCADGLQVRRVTYVRFEQGNKRRAPPISGISKPHSQFLGAVDSQRHQAEDVR